MMRKSIFNAMAFLALSAACLAGPAQTASAAQGEKDGGSVTVRAGAESPVRSFSMPCNNPTYFGISGMGSHGKITTREVTGNHCGRSDFPSTLVIYTPDPGFVGEDDVTLYAGWWRTALKVNVVNVAEPAKPVTTGHAKAGHAAGQNN